MDIFETSEMINWIKTCCIPDWDLGVCLQYECKRKQIHKPDVVNSWIDLRSTYRVSRCSYVTLIWWLLLCCWVFQLLDVEVVLRYVLVNCSVIGSSHSTSSTNVMRFIRLLTYDWHLWLFKNIKDVWFVLNNESPRRQLIPLLSLYKLIQVSNFSTSHVIINLFYSSPAVLQQET